MNQIATDIVATKAMEDRMKAEEKKQTQKQFDNYEIDQEEEEDSDFSDDGEEQDILRKMKERMSDKMSYAGPSIENRTALKGSYDEKTEKEFFEFIESKKERIVVHFSHEKFERCKIVDMHLKQIAYDHPESLIIKLDAENAQFLVNKLKIQVLPVICFFKNGNLKDRLVGFEDFGNRDDFKTAELAQRLAMYGAIDLNEDEKFKLVKKEKQKIAGESESEDED